MAFHGPVVVIRPEDPPSHGWPWAVSPGSAPQALSLAPAAQLAPMLGPRACCRVCCPWFHGDLLLHLSPRVSLSL